jgi:hypothetical protein
VLKQLEGMTFAQLITAGRDARIDGLEGPDRQLQCESSPEYHGHTGPWKTYKYDNNCYNYANDKLVTPPAGPAIPGPGNDLGSSANPLTDDALRNALGADKLEHRGSRLPSSCPPAGAHYVAIVLRHHPVNHHVRDFHCVRLDRDGSWSHKDGNGRVRNKDDVGNKITDLTAAAFKWSPKLMGIYAAFFAKRHLID